LSKINNSSKKITQKSALLQDIEKSSAKVVAMLGAGDIGVMITEITSQLLKKNKHEI
jgi:UDP-N-acetylmuramate--alanine ligase